jgi:hypothetical protein
LRINGITIIRRRALKRPAKYPDKPAEGAEEIVESSMIGCQYPASLPLVVVVVVGPTMLSRCDTPFVMPDTFTFPLSTFNSTPIQPQNAPERVNICPNICPLFRGVGTNHSEGAGLLRALVEGCRMVCNGLRTVCIKEEHLNQKTHNCALVFLSC